MTYFAAFFLVNNGYDVWMPTVRGAGFSTQHKHLTMEDPSYWNFSSIRVTPMGTTMSYIYSSVRKDHANTHLKALISLSPVAYLRTMTPLYKVLVPVFQTLLRSFINAGMYAIGHQQSLHQLIYKMCRLYPTIIACFMINSLGTGLSSEQVLPEMIPVFASYFPAAISMKTLHHFIQLIASGGRFQYYDYGFNNPIYYKSMLAPVYDVSNITLPVFLFIGRKDAIAVDSTSQVPGLLGTKAHKS
ncbi:hypothetical protein NQ318_016251 [Aromia moschata]|uniref:Uncharacterized protein n=1 Tax=Aromia moschata TaxID=1265417 RepID=A0AAV8Y0K3_9CUCU|nr:hypothetical protein NQ318_016251 [Aromia moschata]